MHRIATTRSLGKSMFSFVRNCRAVFHSGCITLHPPARSELLLLHIHASVWWCCVLHFGYSTKGTEAACCFNLQLPHETRCCTSFQMLICQLCIFFGKVSIQIFYPLFNCVVFLLLSFNGSLYILDTNPLSDMCFFKHFFPSLGLIFFFS